MISDKQITKFQQLWKKHYGEEISREEAAEKGTRLLNLMRAIWVPTDEKLIINQNEIRK